MYEYEDEALLRLDSVSIGYQTPIGMVKAVMDATLTISYGDALGIVGESGSGKSTLAHGILRLLPQNAVVRGDILFQSMDLLSCDEKTLNEVRWEKLAVVFQNSMNSLSPVHRIGEQAVDIYKIHEPDATKDEVYDKMRRLFAILNLSDRVLESYPHQLSGGMLQRVCICLSLMHEPQLVIFDEATTALDVITQAQVLEEIRRLQDDLNVTSVIITHDVAVVAETCNTVAVMYAGYIMEVGPVSKVLGRGVKHPYTEGLIESIPSLRRSKERLRGIPGSLPDLKMDYPGCIFAPRCSNAIDICHEELPCMARVSENHWVRCHLIGGEKQ